MDGYRVRVEDGRLGNLRGAFTRHAPVETMADALAVAECVSLFDLAEMPALAAAASKLSRRGPVEVWSLVEEAAKLSHKAGTRPADMPAPTKTMRVAVWTPQEIALRQAGSIVSPKSTRKVEVPL